MHKNTSLSHSKADKLKTQTDASCLRKVTATFSFMFSHPAHILSLGFGSGLTRVMPGTFGTLFGWASFIILFPFFSDLISATVIFTSFVVGVFATQFTAKKLNTFDPGCVVWDEIVAIWLILFITLPSHFLSQLLVFAVFRFFDIVKPPPIRFFDQRLKGGFGIMFDDIVAAFFTLLTISLIKIFIIKAGFSPHLLFKN